MTLSQRFENGFQGILRCKSATKFSMKMTWRQGVVSKYSAGGHVNHSYADRVSILKFIERNWKIGAVTSRSRDNFPDPRGKDRIYLGPDRIRRCATRAQKCRKCRIVCFLRAGESPSGERAEKSRAMNPVHREKSTPRTANLAFCTRPRRLQWARGIFSA